MNRLYVAETAPSPTGSIADHRLPARASQIEAIARGAARGRQRWRRRIRRVGSAEIDKWIAAAAKDLQANRGAGVVVAGDQQPPAVHALAHAMNAALGNAGTTVIYTDPVQPVPVDQLQSLRELVDDMNNGQGRSARHPRRQSRSTPRRPI